MNFKFTKKKVVTSLIISVIFGLIIAFFIYSQTSLIFRDINNLKNAINLGVVYFFIIFIVSFILIYLVYSIIENKSLKKYKK